MTCKKQLIFLKIFDQVNPKFRKFGEKKGKDIFLIFEFLIMREKNTKMTQNMKILDQDTRCMQECYECQDEHQEHFEDHDEHQEHIFEKFSM